MKQTSSALTFLLAQYRAIFKRAYIKGIASAVLLTAGLAAGAASSPAMAAEIGPTLDKGDFTNGTSSANSGTIDQNSSLNLGDIDTSNVSSSDPTKGYTYLGETTIDNATVTITGAHERYMALSGSSNFTIQNGGVLKFSNTVNSDSLLYGGGNEAKSGTFTIKDSGSALELTSAHIGFNKININADTTVTIGGSVVKAKEFDASGADWKFYASIYGNADGGTSGDTTITGATINLNDQSQLGADNNVNIKGSSVINFNGKWNELDKEKKTGYATAFIRGAADTANVTIAAVDDKTPILNIAAGNHGAIFSNNISLTNTKVKIGSGSTFTLDGDFKTKNQADAAVHSGTTLTLDDVFFDNQGTAIIGNATSGGTAEVVSGTTTLTGNVKNYAKVTVKGESGDGKDATLVVSADQLLKEAKKGEGWFAGGSGSIVLSGAAADKATLEIQDIDADGFEVSVLTFTSGNAAADDLVGKIGVSGSGTIAGSHLTLSKALGDMGTNKLRLAADTLEISSDTITTLSDFKATGGFKVQDNIDIDVLGGEATVDTAIDLSRDYYVKTTDGNNTSTLNSVGKITGDDLNIEGSSGKEGKINITGGAFTNERQSLTITSGSLSVTAEAGTNPVTGSDAVGTWPTGDNEAYLNANPASLAWRGNFIINGADTDKATVTVTGKTGADATLDLTSADVTWGSGTITVSGSSMDGEHTSATDFFARGGNGILKIEGNDLTSFIAGKTKLDVKTGGLVLIDGSVAGNVDVGSFESAASASAAGKVNLSGGALFVTGNLSLTADAADEKLNAASGFIGADNLTVNNTTSGTNTFTVSGGATLAAASSFNSDDTSVVFESGSTLLLDTNGFLNAYNNGSDSVGTVNVDKLSFAGTTTNDANLDVQTGNWTVVATAGTAETQILGDIDLANQAKINIGAGRDEVLRTGIGASLTADNLGISGSGSVAIGLSGAATFNTMQAGQNVTVDVDAGTLTLTGVLTDSALAEVASGSAPTTLSTLGNADAIKAVAGINLSGAEVSVDNGGKFILENAAASALVKFNYTAQGATTPSKVWVNDNLGGADITLTNNSELQLNFASGSGELTAAQAQLLQDALADTIDGTSYISVGQMGFAIDYDSGSMTTTWNDVKDFANYNVTNETMKQLLVTGVGAEDIAGHYGAVAATTGTNKIGVDGNLSLHSARGGYFAATTDAAGNLTGPAAVDLVSNNSTFTLEGQGTVGTITGQGTDAADGNTVIFGQGTYQAGTTKVEGDVLDVTKVQVQNDVVQNNVNFFT